MQQKVLHTKNLSVGYKNNPILSNLNLSIEEGSLTCLLGVNGIGKSTLLQTLTGMIPAISGEIFIQKKPLSNFSISNLAHLVSVVFSQNQNSINLKVIEMVALGRTPHTNWLGILSKKDKAIIEKVMEQVSISHLKNKFITQLSDGERQKVMIAKALVQDTPIIILDEPTAHLDIINRVQIISFLKKVAKETRKAILLSTHELETAIQVADSVWLINNKKKIKCACPEDLLISGEFAATFEGDNIKFDLDKGAFKIINNTQKKIKVKGAGLHYFWTIKAIEKKGYLVDNKHPTTNQEIIVGLNDWKLISKDSQKQFTSITALIAALEPKN